MSACAEYFSDQIDRHHADLDTAWQADLAQEEALRARHAALAYRSPFAACATLDALREALDLADRVYHAAH